MVLTVPLAAALLPLVCEPPGRRLGPSALHKREASAVRIMALMATVAMVMIVQTGFELGKWQTNRRLWEHAAFVTPSDATAYYNLGVHFMRDPNLMAKARSARRGDWEKGVTLAEAMFDESLLREPTYGAAINNKGMAMQKRGDLEGAESHFLTAIGLHPDTHYKAWNNLGFVQHMRGDLAGAEANYRQAVQIFPRYDIALFNLANLLHTNPGTNPGTATTRDQRGAEALELYRRCLKFTPVPNAPAHYGLAQLLLQRGGTKMLLAEARSEVLTHLEQAHRIDPRHQNTREV